MSSTAIELAPLLLRTVLSCMLVVLGFAASREKDLPGVVWVLGLLVLANFYTFKP